MLSTSTPGGGGIGVRRVLTHAEDDKGNRRQYPGDRRVGTTLCGLDTHERGLVRPDPAAPGPPILALSASVRCLQPGTDTG